MIGSKALGPIRVAFPSILSCNMCMDPWVVLLGAKTARRHACDANIIPAVLDTDGMPVDIGRQNRLASRTQRQALRSMYRTCAIDGCDHHFDQCQIHHLLEWETWWGDQPRQFDTCSIRPLTRLPTVVPISLGMRPSTRWEYVSPDQQPGV